MHSQPLKQHPAPAVRRPARHGCWAACAGTGLWDRTNEVLDSALKQTAERLLMPPAAALTVPDNAERLAMLGPHDEFVVYQVQDANGLVLLHSLRAPTTPLDTGAPDGLEPARHELDRRTVHDLRPLALQRAPAELQPWLATVNSLLARVAGLVDSERAFAANTAHALRTPLAAARAQAQRLLLASIEPSTRELTQALLRQLDRLTNLASRLLELARVESGVALQRQPVDLVQLAVLVVDEFSEASRHGQLVLTVSGHSVPVQGDVDALGIALRNLIDNARKHGSSAATVSVTVSGQQIRVQDNGAGVPPALLAGLVHPFDRGGPGHALEGSGLGLPMVATIARQSGAGLRLQSPVTHGHGFAATLDFNPDRERSSTPS